MRSLIKKMQTAERLRLELQTELVSQGVPLDNCDAVARLCTQSFEEGYKAGLKQTNDKPNGKPKPSSESRAEAVTVTPESLVNAAAGRRAVANGERPIARDAMVKVMGNKVMNAQAVVDALQAKGWLPATSDPRQYISYLLSYNCPETFERTEKRGHYRVAANAPVARPKPSDQRESKQASFAALWKVVRRRRGAFTTRSLAESLQRRPGQVSGSLVALEKRGLVDRTVVEGEAAWRVTAKGRRTTEL